MSNNHASASSPILDSPSKLVGLIFLNSPSRWLTLLFPPVLTWCLEFWVSLEELLFLYALSSLSGPFLVLVRGSLPLFFSCRLCSKISLISCCFSYSFFNYLLSALYLCISIIRCLIVSSTWWLQNVLLPVAWLVISIQGFQASTRSQLEWPW